MPDPETLLIYRVADFGHTMLSVTKLGAVEFVGIECGWHDNEPFRSCIPEGHYRLEPHGGERYKDTLAFVNEGLGVAHLQTDSCARYACVIHKTRNATALTGCVAFGMSMRLDYSYPTLVDSALAVAHVLSALRWPGMRRAIIENRLGGWTDG